ncbi:3-methyl-2-oxobutanoate hydroxymethyltransferase [candidate division KSB1 bacterium]|nr:3-methyl-2-oxobutanoate hydroxymethyltransferase [candidate division KSB1 bacterium]
MSKLCIRDLWSLKGNGEKISMLTAYDSNTAALLDDAGIDIILVGDSVGTNVLGYASEKEVTLSDIIHHTRAVVRGRKRAFVIADMPFMSYHASASTAISNAGRLIQEARADAVKCECKGELVQNVKAIIAAGIPTMVHIGLTPQTSIDMTSKGRSVEEALAIIELAIEMEKAGAFALLLEKVPLRLADLIMDRVQIPVIGIGASNRCDGQVLVIHDILNLTGTQYKHAKVYRDVRKDITEAAKEYSDDVKAGRFPSDEHYFKMKDDVFEKVVMQLKSNMKAD